MTNFQEAVEYFNNLYLKKLLRVNDLKGCKMIDMKEISKFLTKKSNENFMFKKKLLILYDKIYRFVNSYTYILHLRIFNSKMYNDLCKRKLLYNVTLLMRGMMEVNIGPSSKIIEHCVFKDQYIFDRTLFLINNIFCNSFS